MKPNTFGVVLGVIALCLLLACNPSAAGDSRMVATSNSGTIAYSSIRCHPRLQRDSEACVRSEQQALRRWIYSRAIECAARLERIDLVDADIEAIEAQVAAKRPDFQRIAGRYRSVLRGVIRVQEGESVDQVAVDLNKMGIGFSELEQELGRFDNGDATRRALEKDHASHIEKAARDRMRQDALLRKLKSILEERSRVSARSFAEEETRMWRSAVRTCALRIVDDTYQMPELTGAFEIHVYEHVQKP